MKRTLVLVLAACGAAKAAPAKPKGPVYMALFERGRTWTLPIETVDGHHDKTTGVFAADHDERGTVQCRVADVRGLGDAKLAKLACAKPHDDLLAAGVWIATRNGLFHPPQEPGADEIASYQQGEPLIGAAPAAHDDNAAVEQASTGSQAFVFEHSWCVREAAAAELDRRDYTLCFDAKGVSGGNELVIVGPDQTWRRVRFGNAPRDPDDPTEPK